MCSLNACRTYQRRAVARRVREEAVAGSTASLGENMTDTGEPWRQGGAAALPWHLIVVAPLDSPVSSGYLLPLAYGLSHSK